ncbi:sulfate adenylyltransferase [Nocardioides daedukensis]|uniref:Adenylyl-sulfate kinase n=1 Tax=Nocardioides daedukensis TaxID=634462 RepID=A0A7Y9S3E2_9ACTN|nr:sulfate adenylyltransferase [Nocardioides daedukensis]
MPSLSESSHPEAPSASLPQHCPTPRELDDLELLVSGALAPLTGFNEPGSPVTLSLPDELVGHEIELVDPEGFPIARLDERGSVESLTPPEHGPFRRLHLTPGEVRERHHGATFVPVSGALTDADVTSLAGLGTVVLLALCGTGTPIGLTPVGLIRSALAAAETLPDAHVVAVPLASHGDPTADHLLGHQVVDNYAAGDPVHALTEDPERSRGENDSKQGQVIFFTGLSGSGKSTIARALGDRLLEDGETVTSLDGDVVRRNLSAGLSFSKQDRETNIRRIGWVAAEIARHGGVAICSPIAPFDETRKQVREMVEQAGGDFVLVHVATPLEECERRDRKGLYAKARAGEIGEFTGISSPYEVPEDADVVDTTGRSIEDALNDVLEIL